MSGGWSTGLLDCFSDCNVCKRSFYSLPFPSSYRTKLRGQYMLEEKPCNDCCVHLFCNPCAWCQEYRELQNRGFDVAIGWNGNAPQNCGVVTAPALQGGMNRQSDHK